MGRFGPTDFRALATVLSSAQEQGRGKSHGKSIVSNENNTSAADVGLTRNQVHEARAVCDAEKRKPGIVRDTVNAQLKAGQEKTRANIKRRARRQAVIISANPECSPAHTPSPHYPGIGLKPCRKKAIGWFDHS